MSLETGEKDNLKKDNFAWLNKLRYEKSFTAKLLLSDKPVKDYYALIVGEILSYERVRAHTGWGGVAFSVGKNAFAKVNISGKTLCLYLAASAEDVSSLKYKAAHAGDKKKYEKTPAAFKIKSEGGARYAVKQIEKLAAELKLTKKEDGANLPFLIKPESFDNLVARGLIRVIKGKKHAFEAEDETAKTPENEPIEAEKTVEATGKVTTETLTEAPKRVFTEDITAYEDTALTASELLSRHAFYGELLSAFSAGETSVKSSEKLVLKALDEMWIEKIEAALPSLDYLLRNPTHYISETEEILPIELTRKITGRSVAHLSRHTDYISEVNEDGTVTPTKLLNVFREDSVLTYENKFLNTLISRLYFFVTERFRIIKEKGADEKINEVDYETNFFSGEKRGKIKLTVTLSEEAGEEDISGAKSLYASPLYKRAEKLDLVVKSYAESEFCKELGRNFIRPPVMRTNAILKNKYFRDCLELWEFIESYEDFGAGVTVKEKLFDPSKSYLSELYGAAAMSFLEFLHEANDETGERTAAVEYKTPSFSPKIITEKTPVNEEDYDIKTEPMEEKNADEEEILVNVLAAVKAQKTYRELNPLKREDVSEAQEVETAQEEAINAEEDEVLTLGGTRYIKSFEAKLRLASDEVKAYFVGVMNAFMRYKKVRVSKSFSCVTLFSGRNRLAVLAIKGKTLSLYSAVTKDDMPGKYELFRLKDFSTVKKYEKTPSRLKIKSDRAFSYALQTVSVLAEKFNLVAAQKPAEVFEVAAYPALSFEEMLAQGLIKKTGEGEEIKFVPFDKKPTEKAEIAETAQEVAAETAVTEQEAEETYFDEAAEMQTETPTEDDESSEESSGKIVYKGLEFVKDFEAKIRLADDATKDLFIQILNAFAVYKGVKIRMSGYFTNVKYEKDRIACINMRGKTLCFFTNVLREDSPELYDLCHITDLSDKKKYARTPSMLKVKGSRTLKYALALIAVLEQKYGLKKAKKVKKLYTAEDFPKASFEELLSLGLIHKLKDKTPQEDTAKQPKTVDEELVSTTETADEIYEEVKVKDDLKSFEFGVKGNPFAEVPAAEIMPPKAVLEAEEKVVEEGVREEKFEREEKTLPGISYPESMDYSRPSLKGVDDVKGFIADEKGVEESAEEAERKGVLGWLKRLFKGGKGSKGGKR